MSTPVTAAVHCRSCDGFLCSLPSLSLVPMGETGVSCAVANEECYERITIRAKPADRNITDRDAPNHSRCAHCDAQVGNADARRIPPRVNNNPDGVAYLAAKHVQVHLSSGETIKSNQWVKIIPQLPSNVFQSHDSLNENQTSDSDTNLLIAKFQDLKVNKSVQDNKLPSPISSSTPSSSNNKLPSVSPAVPSGPNARARLYELCDRMRAKLEFKEQKSEVEFSYLCVVNGQPVSEGFGISKKKAQEDAAAQALADFEEDE